MKMTGGTWNGIAAYGATGRSRIRDYHVVVGTIGQITSEDEQHGSVDEILEKAMSRQECGYRTTKREHTGSE
jgi:hypothetical protein